MSRERRALITALRTQTEGQRIFGYDSRKAGCAEMPRKGVPENWDRLAVEGDQRWTELPRVDDEPNA